MTFQFDWFDVLFGLCIQELSTQRLTYEYNILVVKQIHFISLKCHKVCNNDQSWIKRSLYLSISGLFVCKMHIKISMQGHAYITLDEVMNSMKLVIPLHYFMKTHFLIFAGSTFYQIWFVPRWAKEAIQSSW